MQKVTAKLNRLQIGPRKVRLVADLIRGKKVLEAERILKVVNKASALPVLKLLQSAVANAKHNYNLSAEKLIVSTITVNEGPVMRRFTPRAHGSASPILKRSSHIFLELLDKSEDGASKKETKEDAAPADKKVETKAKTKTAAKAKTEALKKEKKSATKK